MIERNVALAPLTTLRVGGPAQAYLRIAERDALRAFLASHYEGPIAVLGGGSNTLVRDEGVNALVLHVAMSGILFTPDGDDVLLIADAGTSWEEVVDSAIERGLYGIENLAGIPGTIGGAVVQNIGAYGAELRSVFEYADCTDLLTKEEKRVQSIDAHFGYRDSLFKQRPELLITRVALRLHKKGTLDTSYQDIARVHAVSPLTTPRALAEAVRDIRRGKFPDLAKEGTAGSFFKNPVVSVERAEELQVRYPELPSYVAENGVKISAAWLLDHALGLRGYAQRHVRLYEKQPLVLVTNDGAQARDVEALAENVAQRMHDVCAITLVREVVTLDAKIKSYPHE